MSMIRDLRAAVRPRPSPRTVACTTTPAPPGPTPAVDGAVYRDGARVQTPEPLTPQEAMRLVHRDGGFVWIGLHEPTEAGLPVSRASSGCTRWPSRTPSRPTSGPAGQRYDDSLFTVFKTIHYAVEHDELTATSEIVETGEVMCFTGRDFFITVRHGGQGVAAGPAAPAAGRPRAARQGPLRRATPSPTTSSNRQYIAARGRRAGRHRRGGDRGSRRPQGHPRRGTDAGRIYQLKREVLEFKPAVSPLLRPRSCSASARCG